SSPCRNHSNNSTASFKKSRNNGTGSAGHAGATAMTCFPVFGPIFAGKFQFSGMCDSGRWTRKDPEEIEVHGGADCLHPAAGRGRHSGRRDLPQGRNQRSHVLQLAQEVRWAHAVRDEATASARGRERQTEENRG